MSAKTRGDSRAALAIVVGGGPAPGINGVISAATIAAINRGCRVLGVVEGFKWISRGDTSRVIPLTIDDVSRIHNRGGSILRTSRHNPTRSPEDLKNVIAALKTLGVNYLVTIGGDDTCFSASQVAATAGKAIAVAHVPKTIDNDLPLPHGMPTFGFQTARSVGDGIVQSLMEDAKTTANRWYIVVAMGRTAGHLALGIGKSAGATLTIIPEEFGKRDITLAEICDILEASIIKRLAGGRDFGVAILAEGLASGIKEKDLAGLGHVERDEHGHIRLAEINLGQIVKDVVRKSLAARGIKMTLVAKDLGYELRCADPVPFDTEYTRDLGYGAVRFLLGGGTAALINYAMGRLQPIPFDKLLDPETHRTKVRKVDLQAEAYEVARQFMIRLDAGDLDDPDRLGKLAESGKMSAADFKKRFAYLVRPGK